MSGIILILSLQSITIDAFPRFCNPTEDCLVQCYPWDKCEQQVNCPDNYDCIVECLGDNACSSVSIDCPVDGKCNIKCDGNNACNSGIIYCSTSTLGCHVLCDGPNACYNAKIYWPVYDTINRTLTCDPDGDDMMNQPCGYIIEYNTLSPSTSPITFQPTTALPTTTLPTTHVPTTYNPTTSLPSMIPTTSIPTTYNPTSTPSTSIPTTSTPTTSIPTTSMPTTSTITTDEPTSISTTFPNHTVSPMTTTVIPIAPSLDAVTPTHSPSTTTPSPTILYECNVTLTISFKVNISYPITDILLINLTTDLIQTAISNITLISCYSSNYEIEAIHSKVITSANIQFCKQSDSDLFYLYFEHQIHIMLQINNGQNVAAISTITNMTKTCTMSIPSTSAPNTKFLSFYHIHLSLPLFIIVSSTAIICCFCCIIFILYAIRRRRAEMHRHKTRRHRIESIEIFQMPSNLPLSLPNINMIDPMKRSLDHTDPIEMNEDDTVSTNEDNLDDDDDDDDILNDIEGNDETKGGGLYKKVTMDGMGASSFIISASNTPMITSPIPSLNPSPIEKKKKISLNVPEKKKKESFVTEGFINIHDDQSQISYTEQSQIGNSIDLNDELTIQ